MDMKHAKGAELVLLAGPLKGIQLQSCRRRKRLPSMSEITRMSKYPAQNAALRQRADWSQHLDKFIFPLAIFLLGLLSDTNYLSLLHAPALKTHKDRMLKLSPLTSGQNFNAFKSPWGAE